MLLTGMDTVSSISQLITVLIMFVLVLALTVGVTRWIARYQKSQRAGGNIEIVETCPIGNGKCIQIVRLGKTYAAIAVCKDTVTMLAELPQEEMDFPSQEGGGMRFMDFLARAREKLPEKDIPTDAASADRKSADGKSGESYGMFFGEREQTDDGPEKEE